MFNKNSNPDIDIGDIKKLNDRLERIVCALEKIADNFYNSLEYQKSSALPKFTGRNVPIEEIAKATGKDPQYLRKGLQSGDFKFGYALLKDGSTEYNYFCPDKKVWEDLGYFNPDGTVKKKRL